MVKKIGYQGEAGANSHIACNIYDNSSSPIALKTFDEVFISLEKKEIDLAMIPIENTIAGRVSDIHRLMPTSNVNIIGETFLKINHCLMSLKESSLKDIKTVRSHEMALSQCRNSILNLGLEPVVSADTAGSALSLIHISEPTRPY